MIFIQKLVSFLMTSHIEFLFPSYDYHEAIISDYMYYIMYDMLC